ncbi:MAG: NUDIX domain-containing protein [Candidatus Woesearchaeota archaeon]|nr:NUDIX domain-containing protein [Candidatus Woesearchaeota archaeon]
MAEQTYPEPAVGALIFNPEGNVFLMKSHKWHGKYVIPGGHIELGERMEDTVRREVKEETGLDVYAIEFISFQEFIFDTVFWKKRHFIFFDFACKTKSKNVVLNDEAQEHCWASLAEALKMPVEPYTRKAIEAYIKKKGN